ncbi:MAG: DUF4159 domain-containing protein [Sphingobacteriales bacterium]|jgi:hypothetical protein|nr:MAG: DUF4159 domain-containing protein [Sphingobacteriales bacterium]
MKLKKTIAFLYIPILFLGFIILGINLLYAQPSYKMAKLKYSGGGDWYANRTALPNLIGFCNQNIKTNFDPSEAIVEASSADIFNYPYVYLTGHGNITFNPQESQNIRNYLMGGGFLHIDDNYGLDKFIRPQMKKVFPELDFVELPPTHAIYNQTYTFTQGLPKIHEHNGKRPQGFALIYKGKIICFYSYECDLGNGWEDYGTYPDDTQQSRQKALKMGANLVEYAFKQ